MTVEDVENRVRPLQAKAISLQARLADLKDRRDRGRLDDGRYTDLAGDLDRERIEILIQLRGILGARDDDFDHILNSAIDGTRQEDVATNLVDLAKKKGFASNLINSIQNNRGTIISWFVNIGLEIVRQTQK
jgi:hypothetical protein